MQNTQMLDYIKDTPVVAQNLVKQFKKNHSKISLAHMANVIFVGSGSSLNIATVASVFYENELFIGCKLYHPDSFLALPKINADPKTTLVIGVSQTGTSSGTVQAIKNAKGQGFKTVVLTERPNTPLEDAGDVYFNFQSGEEKCNAKTKGYTNSLILLYLIGMEIGKVELEKDKNDKILEMLSKAINEITQTMDSFDEWFKQNLDWTKIDNLLVIGAAQYMGSTEEGSLKISETTLVPSRYSSFGEFSHGLHRTLNSNTNVILVNSENEDLVSTYQYLEHKVSRVLLIDTTEQVEKSDISVNNLQFNLSAINVGIVFQMLSYYLPTYVGHDPNAEINHDYELLVHNRL